VEAELTEARHLFAADQEILNKRLHAREVEIDALKKTIEEKEALVSTNEKLDRELKHGKILMMKQQLSFLLSQSSRTTLSAWRRSTSSSKTITRSPREVKKVSKKS
jgi:hypothetical protein